jgi:hypothetical protein
MVNEPIKTADPAEWFSQQPDMIVCAKLQIKLTERACRLRQKTWRHTINTNHDATEEIVSPLFMGCVSCERFKFDPKVEGLTSRERALGKRPGAEKAHPCARTTKPKKQHKAAVVSGAWAWRRTGRAAEEKRRKV